MYISTAYKKRAASIKLVRRSQTFIIKSNIRTNKFKDRLCIIVLLYKHNSGNTQAPDHF